VALNFDYYVALSAVCLLTLLTTLKLTLTGRVTVGPQHRNFILFHPVWLGMLAIMVPFVVGRYLNGSLSPFPPAAFADAEAKAGLWAGVLAGLSTTTIDLWLFWTTATALMTFTQPMSVTYEPIPKAMGKYFHLVNAIAGAFVIYKALHAPAA
jgi:hypothetical protein